MTDLIKPLASKSITPMQDLHQSVPISLTPASDAPTSASQVTPDKGGSYVIDPSTGTHTLVTPSTTESKTRKVQDPITGVITRKIIQE